MRPDKQQACSTPTSTAPQPELASTTHLVSLEWEVELLCLDHGTEKRQNLGRIVRLFPQHGHDLFQVLHVWQGEGRVWELRRLVCVGVRCF